MYPRGTGDSVRYGYGGPNSPTDESAVTSVHADYNGSPWMTPVPRIDRGAGGTIAKLWFAQHSTPTLPTDPSIEREYDTNKRLTAVRWRTGDNTSADLGDYAYSYANSGQLASIVNSAPGGSSMDSQHFAYDTLGRLTCVAKSPVGTTCDTTDVATVARYEYDGFNNRSSSFYRDPSGATHTHFFNYGGVGDRARLRSWARGEWPLSAQMSVGYGDVPTAGSAPGHRIFESRPAAGGDPAVSRYWGYYNGGRAAYVSMSDARGSSTHYFGYDHLGRRKAAYQYFADGTVVHDRHFYDVFGRKIGTYTTTYSTSGTTWNAQPIYLVDNEPVFRLGLAWNGGWGVTGGEYLYDDHAGTPRIAVSWGTPTVTYRASTETFLAGPATQDTGLYPTRTRFPGQWEDRGTGFVTTGGSALSAPMSALVANHARVYDPGLGAYGQREPMVSVGRWAGVEGVSPWFGYAGWRPTQFVDPDGRIAWAAVLVPLIDIGVAIGVVAAGYFEATTAIDSYYYSKRERSGDRSFPAIAERLTRDQSTGQFGNATDAVRHCLWQCNTALRGAWGNQWAQFGGGFHEAQGDPTSLVHRCMPSSVNTPGDRGMDYLNNYTARQLADSIARRGRGDCESSCMTALRTNQLITSPSDARVAAPGASTMSSGPSDRSFAPSGGSSLIRWSAW